MNKERRKRIEKVMEKLEQLKEEIEEISGEEEEAFNSLPESLQNCERGETMTGVINNMEYAADNIQEAINELIEAKRE